MSGEAKIKVEQYRSGIGYSFKQKRVLAGMGLGKMNRIVELPDNACTRGMVKKIPHLVRIVENR